MFKSNGIASATSDYTRSSYKWIDNGTAQADKDESERTDEVEHDVAECAGKRISLNVTEM